MRAGDTMVDGSYKGLPPLLPPTPIEAVGALGWTLLGDELPACVAVLRDDALVHNRAWMRRFLAETGAVLAPHGKTTMSPELFRDQLDDGAWAMTVATVHQAEVARRAGCRRVLLANEVVTGPELAWIAEALRDPEFEVIPLVDGEEGVRRLAAIGGPRPVPVLVEVGVPGGRAGCRDVATACALAERVARTPGLRFRGVEAFEGLIPGATMEEREARVAAFLDTVCAVAERVVGLAEDPVLTAGGSIFPDLVARRFAAFADRYRLVLRSGCYLTGDHGIYAAAAARLTERDPRLGALGTILPGIEVWASVLSRPEPGRVILAAGKRDLGTDAGLPVALRAVRGGAVAPIEGRIAEVNDQHAHLVVSPDVALTVGDRVALGIGHPCTTFDRWSVLLRVDPAWRVTGAVRTVFG